MSFTKTEPTNESTTNRHNKHNEKSQHIHYTLNTFILNDFNNVFCIREQ